MPRTEEKRDTARTRLMAGESDRETGFPVSPLSIRRARPVESMHKVMLGVRMWAGAFRDGAGAFHSLRFETVAEARLPYFLHTLRGGHLFSSCAPFAFPLDLLPVYGPPGELTVLSTGSIVATLRLAWSAKSGIEGILQRDLEFSGVLVSRLRELEETFIPASFQTPP